MWYLRSLTLSRLLWVVSAACLSVGWADGERILEAGEFVSPPLTTKEGFEVSLAAAPPLVGYPMMACFDDRGRLYIAESDGRNLTTREAIERELPRFVRRLEDVDGDGVFDKSTIFADRMTMPEGGLWHDGALYIISAPYLWRLEDLDDDGVADKREKILGSMEFDGRANQHGPYLGPDGRLYFSGGHFGYDLVGPDGSRSGVSRAAGVFSCWPDGSDVRVDGQGGINPVDIVFTPEGEMLSTCAIFDSHGGRHDALIHWIRGGLTQRVYGVPLLAETGYRLPATTRWGQVAPAGLVRYRGSALGEDYDDALFACHFNTQAVLSLRLTKKGATFVTEEEAFLTSSSIDFHPADILEDADGSLLLLDTGGWLSWGCPHSQIAKPQIKGAIYRIRRHGVEKSVLGDVRGLELEWATFPADSVAALLGDPRPFVRDRAREFLVTRGQEVVGPVSALLKESDDIEVKKRCLWVLSRLGGELAVGVLREALDADDAGVRQVAVKSLGRWRDKASVPKLMHLLKDPDPAVQRSAATALGRMGESGAVPALFEVLHPDADLYIQHAATYALIEIGDVEATLRFLGSEEAPHWQKIALRVLDQMKGMALKPETVMALLESPHRSVQEEAQRIIASRPEWEKEILVVFDALVDQKTLTPSKAQQLENIAVALGGEEAFHFRLAKAMSDEQISGSVRAQLLVSIGFLEELPEMLEEAARTCLSADELRIRGEALAVLLRFGWRQEATLTALRKLAGEERSWERAIRVAALEVMARWEAPLDEDAFIWLVRMSEESSISTLLRRQSAQALGYLRLTPESEKRGRELCEVIEEASPLQINALLGPFVSLADDAETWPVERRDPLGILLGKALEKSPGRASVPSTSFVSLLEFFDRTSAPQAHRILGELASGAVQGAREREARLTALVEQLGGKGNGSRGRVLFHASRTTCALCHRIEGVGGTLGPDLSKIGSIRSRRDLLEAIVYPDATVVNGYENYLVTTNSRVFHSGLVQRETPDAIYLQGPDQRVRRVPRDQITEMTRSITSAMPSGLDQLFSLEELADLLTFLENCQ